MPRPMTQAEFDAQRSRGWCFTLNNYDDEGVQKVLALSTKVDYMIAGYEVATTGTPHIQGYLYRRNPVKGKTLRLALGKAKWLTARAPLLENYAYCQKEGNLLVEAGVAPQKHGGDSVKERAEKNQRLISGNLHQLVQTGEISMVSVPAIKKARLALLQEADEYDPPKDVKRGIWIYGKSGVGKSRWVREKYGDKVFVKPQTVWWCAYAGEKYVLIDDMDVDHLAHELKRWADIYPCKGRVKGMGEIKLQHEKIIVTSNFSIDSLFKEKYDWIEPLKRRFQEFLFEASPDPGIPVITEMSSNAPVRERDEWGSLRC